MRAALVRQAVRYPLSCRRKTTRKYVARLYNHGNRTVTDECDAPPYWAQVSQACPLKDAPQYHQSKMKRNLHHD